MQILGHTAGGAAPAKDAGFALGADMSQVITNLATPQEARALARGSVVGDQHGGLTFTDAVAAALESRSFRGWHEFVPSPGAPAWTLIVVDR